MGCDFNSVSYQCSYTNTYNDNRCRRREVDIENAIENALEEAYEDAEFNNTKELIDFVDRWNKANHIHSFYPSDIAV